MITLDRLAQHHPARTRHSARRTRANTLSAITMVVTHTQKRLESHLASLLLPPLLQIRQRLTHY
jgi:hypothetical protein